MKKKSIISGLLAAALTVSFSIPAYAAQQETIYQQGANSFILSNYVSKEHKTFTLKGYIGNSGATKTVTSDIYTVAVGSKINVTGNLSNDNVIEIDNMRWDKQNDGTYLNDKHGGINSDAISAEELADYMTFPAEYSGKLVDFSFTPVTGDTLGKSTDVYFLVQGGNKPQPTAPVVAPSKPSSGTKATSSKPVSTSGTYKSDTTAPVALGQGSSYTFKITSLNGKKPTFSAGGNAFKSTYVKHNGKCYYFKVTATGKEGASCGVYINGEKNPVSTLKISNSVIVDTGKSLKVKAGKTYQFKITSNCGKPVFQSGTQSAFTVKYNGRKGIDYFFVVKAVGKVGQGAGFYLNYTKNPVTVGTIK